MEEIWKLSGHKWLESEWMEYIFVIRKVKVEFNVKSIMDERRNVHIWCVEKKDEFYQDIERICTTMFRVNFIALQKSVRVSSVIRIWFAEFSAGKKNGFFLEEWQNPRSGFLSGSTLKVLNGTGEGGIERVVLKGCSGKLGREATDSFMPKSDEGFFKPVKGRSCSTLKKDVRNNFITNTY